MRAGSSSGRRNFLLAYNARLHSLVPNDPFAGFLAPRAREPPSALVCAGLPVLAASPPLKRMRSNLCSRTPRGGPRAHLSSPNRSSRCGMRPLNKSKTKSQKNKTKRRCSFPIIRTRYLVSYQRTRKNNNDYYYDQTKSRKMEQGKIVILERMSNPRKNVPAPMIFLTPFVSPMRVWWPWPLPVSRCWRGGCAWVPRPILTLWVWLLLDAAL